MLDTSTARAQEISVVVKIVPLPGKESEVCERLKAVAIASSQEPGSIFYELFQDNQGGRELYFLGRWSNQESLAAHNLTQHVKDLRSDQWRLISELSVISMSKIL